MNARRWTLVLAALATVLARLMAHYALGDVPHVMDEIAYVYQAKTYLTGHLTGPVLTPRAAFALWFVDDRAAKYGIFPPGWPMVLAIGQGLHLREWVNPLLHGITTLVVARSAEKLGGVRARVLAALLYGLSPQALFLAASLMSHTLVAFGAALALSAGISAIARDPAKSRGLGIVWGGLGVAVALLARPLCGVVVAVGLGALLVVAVTRKKVGIGQSLLVAAPIALGLGLLLTYNRDVTGNATRFPQTVWFDEHAPPLDDPFFRYRPGCNELGFGPGHGCDEGIKNAAHDLPNALSNTGDNITSWLFLAGGGPLSLLAPIFVIWLADHEKKKVLLAAATMVPTAIVLYALYWYAGTCFGARFYQAALPALLLFGALALSDLDRFKARATTWATLLWLAASAPGLVIGLDEIRDHYWGSDDRYVELAKRWNHGPSVVMVAFKTDGLPMHMLKVTGFTSHSPHSVWHNSVRVLGALSLNTVKLDDDEIIFTKFHPALVSTLRNEFPNRAFYIYIAADSSKDDELRIYRASDWADVALAPPKDNFDGFVPTPNASPR